MFMNDECGVSIDAGVQDYQIFQQNAEGQACISVRGHFTPHPEQKNSQVILRLVCENSGEWVTRNTGWQLASQQDSQQWAHTFSGVPCGGPYRLETAIRSEGILDEWALRGHMAHHLGVGDIWVIAGQSNSAGYGKSPIDDPPELGVHCFFADGQWKLACHPLSDSTHTKYPANREGANGSHSPYLHFAKLLKRRLNYPIGLIPAALGGSAIARWLKSIKGELFDNMCAYCRDAGADRVKGVLWYQGESETSAESAGAHLARFTELVGDFRSYFKDPKLPVITAQLNHYNAFPNRDDPAHLPWEMVRETQRQAARCIPGVYVVSTLDLGLSDDIHNNSSANMVIGERMASCALGGVVGMNIKYLHPDLRSARQTGPREIVLQFDQVDGYLELFNLEDWNRLFSIRDAAGQADIEKIVMAAPDCLHLHTQQDIGAPARIVGAPGANPTQQVLFDYAGHRPMLAFIADIVP
jgi:sialate O-acetylesterase